MNEIAEVLPVNEEIHTPVSFEDIYRSYADYVYSVAYGIVVNHDDAAEVTQETFVKVHKTLNHFRGESDLKTWLYRITVNTALTYLRKHRPRQNAQVELDKVYLQEAGPSIEDAAGSSRQQSGIMALLHDMRPDYRACVTLRNIQGLSYQEIADTLHENINTVRTKLRRARLELLRRIAGGDQS